MDADFIRRQAEDHAAAQQARDAEQAEVNRKMRSAERFDKAFDRVAEFAVNEAPSEYEGFIQWAGLFFDLLVAAHDAGQFERLCDGAAKFAAVPDDVRRARPKRASGALILLAKAGGPKESIARALMDCCAHGERGILNAVRDELLEIRKCVKGEAATDEGLALGIGIDRLNDSTAATAACGSCPSERAINAADANAILARHLKTKEDNRKAKEQAARHVESELTFAKVATRATNHGRKSDKEERPNKFYRNWGRRFLLVAKVARQAGIEAELTEAIGHFAQNRSDNDQYAADVMRSAVEGDSADAIGVKLRNAEAADFIGYVRDSLAGLFQRVLTPPRARPLLRNFEEIGAYCETQRNALNDSNSGDGAFYQAPDSVTDIWRAMELLGGEVPSLPKWAIRLAEAQPDLLAGFLRRGPWWTRQDVRDALNDAISWCGRRTASTAASSLPSNCGAQPPTPGSNAFCPSARQHHFNRLAEDYLAALARARRKAKNAGNPRGRSVNVPVPIEPLRAAVQTVVDKLLTFATEEAECLLAMAKFRPTSKPQNPFSEEREGEVIAWAKHLQPEIGTKPGTTQDYLLAEEWNRAIPQIQRKFAIQRATFQAALTTIPSFDDPPTIAAPWEGNWPPEGEINEVADIEPWLDDELRLIQRLGVNGHPVAAPAAVKHGAVVIRNFFRVLDGFGIGDRPQRPANPTFLHDAEAAISDLLAWVRRKLESSEWLLVSALERIMRPPAADIAATAGFRGQRHDSLLARLQRRLQDELPGKPDIALIQGLQDQGCDLIIEWHLRAKYGVQLKSNGDVEQAEFARSTVQQIQDSRQHGLKRLFVILVADITGRSNLEKVRALMSRISTMNDPYVAVVPPESAWNLLFPPSDETKCAGPMAESD